MKKLILVSLFICLSVFIYSDNSEKDVNFTIEGIRTYWFGFIPSGLDVGFTFNNINFLPDYPSSIWLKIGGGYQEKLLYREETAVPYTGIADSDSIKYMTVNGQLELGLFQNLYTSSPDSQLDAFFLFRPSFYYNIEDLNASPSQIIFSESFFAPESEGLLSNSLILGAFFDSVKTTDHDTKDGIYAEVSIEWGPSWLLNTVFGSSDFVQLNGTVKGFYTLFDSSPNKPLNLFSVYLADFLSIDYSDGLNIPLYVMQSFGGLDRRGGIGGSVRGFEKWRFNTQFKFVNNIEIRINGPAIILPSIIPSFVGYFDAGFFVGFFNDPSNTEGGFLASTGFGIYINVLNFTHLGATLDFPLYGERLDGSPSVFNIVMGLHF